MMRLIYRICKICSNVFGVLFGLLFAGTIIANENSSAISAFLGAKTYEIIQEGSVDSKDVLYYTSSYVDENGKGDFEALKKGSDELCKQVVAEGSVLLKNNGILPLERNVDVSLYSSSSVNFVYTGAGSSAVINASRLSLYDALKEKFNVNEELWKWYEANPQFSGTRTNGQGIVASVKDASWEEIATPAKTKAAKAAIFVLSRYGGEGEDLISSGGNSGDMTNGNYLQLSPSEISVLTNLKALKDAGSIGGIIVLMNSANQVQCDFIDDPAYGIDAMLWVGEPGSTGTAAIADILDGTTTPSGKLSDTFWKEHRFNPVYANWGAYAYNGTVSTANSGKSNTYVVYQEGIYNGYRYTETRYEDLVAGREKVGEFQYADAVAYPFGYGLSYTTFEQTVKGEPVYDEQTDRYDLTVTVKNTGEYAGKEVVELYLQKPYTEYDRANGVEKSAVELVAFAKTDVLPPQQEQDVLLSVDKKYFASYDATGAQTYVLEGGEYYLSVGTDAHQAVNHILADKGFTEESGMTSAGDPSMTRKITLSADMSSYALSAATGNAIQNRFDNTDINRYDGRGENKAQYLSRSDWQGTAVFGFGENQEKLENNVALSATERMSSDSQIQTVEQDTKEYPVYGADNGKTLLSLRADIATDENGKRIETPIAYDDPRWEELLDQLTWEEMVILLSDGLRNTKPITSVSKPETLEHNGAMGPVESFNYNASVASNRYYFLSVENGETTADYPTQNPCNALVASTYNMELARTLGEGIGENCLWAGYAGLCGPGVNVHRGAYGGRAFEYYGEDPLLTGKIAAAEIRGIQSKGCYVYVKHALLNESESNREGICVWANEQTVREIYLRPFELAIVEGGAYNVMTSFNRLGVVWSGAQGFVDSVLRGEFGMKGFAVSSYWQSTYMSLASGILNGNDLPCGTTISGGLADTSALNAYKVGYGELAWKMRESAHRILYVTVQSNAMNGITFGTKIVAITPWWQIALDQIRVEVGTLFVISSALAFGLYFVARDRRPYSIELR